MYPVSESLLCLALQRTRFIPGAVFFTWGSHSWQKNTSYFFAHPSFRAAILKAILSFHRINHFEIFVEQSQLITLDCFQQETYSQSQDRRHYFTLSGWPSLSFQTWAGVIVLFWIFLSSGICSAGVRGTDLSMRTDRLLNKFPLCLRWFPWHAVCFVAIWVIPRETQCGKTGKPRGENGSHQWQHPFSNLLFQESTVLLWAESHQSSPKVQKSKIFLYELNKSYYCFFLTRKTKTHLES